MGKLAQGTGDVKLAAFLSKLFGDDFDLKAAAALIDTLKKDPAALDKMKAAADKQRAKKQPAEMKKLGFGYDLAADCALWN